MFRDTMKMVAVSGVVSLAVSFGMLHASPATQTAQATEAQLSVPVAAQASTSAAETYGDSSSIVEVYSDGGYSYWMERAGWQG